MNYHIHLLDSQNHSHIIDRQDAVTGDTIKANDEVVFCSACQSVFLKESWEYMNEEHCGHTETLSFIPTPPPTLVAKKHSRNKRRNDKLIFEFDDNLMKVINAVPSIFCLLLLFWSIDKIPVNNYWGISFTLVLCFLIGLNLVVFFL